VAETTIVLHLLK